MKRQEKAVKRVRLQTSLYCHDKSAPTHFTPTATILFSHSVTQWLTIGTHYEYSPALLTSSMQNSVVDNKCSR